jgi:hypothetical protein
MSAIADIPEVLGKSRRSLPAMSHQLVGHQNTGLMFFVARLLPIKKSVRVILKGVLGVVAETKNLTTS